MRDDPELEVLVPPKGERRRVLLVGGSNTQLFPGEVLEERLVARSAEAGGRRGWEVVNLGRPGYGSERLRIYLAQAMVLEPDVVVIYTGHNEFVEAGFADDLHRRRDHAATRWTDRATRALQRLRTFNLLTRAFAPDRPRGDAWQTGGDAPRPSHDPQAWFEGAAQRSHQAGRRMALAASFRSKSRKSRV